MQGRWRRARGDSLTRSVGEWLVVKVGDGPRFVAMAARPNRAPSPEHITGRAKRAAASGAGTLACVVPVRGSLTGTSSSAELSASLQRGQRADSRAAQGEGVKAEDPRR